jgi:hypothetical protein
MAGENSFSKTTDERAKHRISTSSQGGSVIPTFCNFCLLKTERSVSTSGSETHSLSPASNLPASWGESHAGNTAR